MRYLVKLEVRISTKTGQNKRNMENETVRLCATGRGEPKSKSKLAQLCDGLQVLGVYELVSLASRQLDCTVRRLSAVRHLRRHDAQPTARPTTTNVANSRRLHRLRHAAQLPLQQLPSAGRDRRGAGSTFFTERVVYV